MSVLSDQDINEAIALDRLGVATRQGAVQPASIDLTLGDEFLIYRGGSYSNGPVYDVYEPPHPPIDLNDVQVDTKLWKSSQYELRPREFILGTTDEFVEIPHDLVAVVNGKSSLARIGLLIHITAGFIDPGFRGKITLEIVNLNKMPIILRAGKPICQISFMNLTSPAIRPYGHPDLKSKYQHQDQVTDSRYAA